MQSVLNCGRSIARAFFTGINNEFSQQIPWPNQQGNTRQSHFNVIPKTSRLKSLRLVTVASGVGKTQSSSTQKITRKFSFGDDAYFVADNTTADVIGVADGVGGWRTYGVDPSTFPRTLMETCEHLVQLGHFSPQAPKDVLSTSYQKLIENEATLIGSSTACVVSLHKEENKLYTANLGDSGFMVIRMGEVIHRSQEQQHFFNTPFQLSLAPNVLEGVVLSDSPDSAQTASLGVRDGDIILVGTDGLFDNMCDDMILDHISRIQDHETSSIQMVANNITNEAHKLAFDPEYMSPFALNAAANGYDIKGGKPDDITVLLSRVTEGDPFT